MIEIGAELFPCQGQPTEATSYSNNRLSRRMLIPPEEAIAYLFNEGGDEIRRAMFT